MSEVWSSGGKLGHCLWKLFSKRTGQELSGHDDVIHDFHHRLKPSQSSQEDGRLPENAGTAHRSCDLAAASRCCESQLLRWSYLRQDGGGALVDKTVSYIRKETYRPATTPSADPISRTGYPPWILKQSGLESSGQRLISSIG